VTAEGWATHDSAGADDEPPRSDEQQRAADERERLHREAVGSVAEEAAKLAEALREWAGPGLSGGLSGGLLGGLWGTPTGSGGHAGHVGEAPECQVCPLCRGIAFVRAVGPEAQHHLTTAGVALLQAAAAASAGWSARQRHEPPRGDRGEPTGAEPDDGWGYDE